MRSEIKLWAIISFGPLLLVAMIFAAQGQENRALMSAHVLPQLIYFLAPMGLLVVLFLSLGGKRNAFPIWLLITGILAQIAAFAAFMGYFYMALLTGLCIVGFSSATARHQGD
ncbi:hypothetical protein [Lentibacter sp.]|uniref:hypothetical protein n=1 Tax=Lentibacter sp. TaxID=2024994 RepID=UPI003F69C283